ncbi:PA-phosphatase-like phosphoesterase [Halovivax asiaticus JCM 14624]|uniref:PA-phosphatase-like phosphoesterase n=1 Tax=Halovivax asiaticus JCM 14624 TaxID=1227490 RepID=M0BDI4_9EURY|nr:PA-phosphatase-like phosphoesterase [Halovivax asiaticus JCM 14624]
MTSLRDVGVTRLLRESAPEWLVPLADAVTLLGDLAVIVGGLAVAVLVDIRRGRRDSRERLVSDRTAFLVGVVLGGLAFTLILKTVVAADRPPTELQAIGRHGHGFPSGHTMAAALLWGALAIWGRTGSRRMRLLVASTIVGLVAVSRLVLGVHYLADVVASVAIAVGFLVVAGVTLAGEPRRALGTAAVLGVAALIVTGGNVDGVVAFGGCLGAAAGWWLSRIGTDRLVRRVYRQAADR